MSSAGRAGLVPGGTDVNPSSPVGRRCTACGVTKPLTEYRPPRYRTDRPGVVFHFRRCRACLRGAEAARRRRRAAVTNDLAAVLVTAAHQEQPHALRH